MKKILILSALIISASLAGNSYAKTEGAMAGVSYVLTHAKYKGIYQHKETVANTTHITERKSYNMHGAAIDLKYAANVNNFFIAPGIFYEQSSFGGENSANKNIEKIEQRGIQIQHRFGVKLDAGYDINYFASGARQTVSPYVTGGYAAIKYKAKDNMRDPNNNRKLTINQEYDQNWFIGGGLKFDIARNLAVNMEYNWQRADIKSQIPDSSVNIYHPVRFKTALHIARIGLVVKF